MRKKSSSTDRTLIMRSLALSPQACELHSSVDKDIHIIGLGTAGCSALHYFQNKKIAAKYTAITETNDLVSLEGIEHIPFTPPRYVRYKMKDRLIWYPDLDKQIVLPNGIKELFSQDHRFILLAGLGGYTGTYMAEVLSTMLNDCEMLFYTICSLPFPFEGTERNTFAITTFNKLRHISNFRYFDFKVLAEQYGDISLAKAFEKGDEKFYEIYRSFSLSC